MKTVFVSGANRGLGLGFARHYLGSGCRVIATSRSPEQSEALTLMAEEHGDRLIPMALEMTSEQSIEAVARKLAGFGLDIIINNAGISEGELFGHWTSGVFETSLKVNAIGPALLSQALAPLMKVGSKLINVSSGMGSLALNVNPENGLDAYAMSKAALNMLTRRVAAKLEPRGIIVVTVSPGWVKTDMGGEGAPTSVYRAVGEMAAMIDDLTMKHSGRFYAFNWEELPW